MLPAVQLSRAPDQPYKHQIYQQFVAFMSLPDPDRCEMLDIPFDEKSGKYVSKPTMGAFAKKFGVHTDTLRVWKQRDDFSIAVSNKQKQWGSDLVPNVMASLYRRCIRYGQAYDIELWLAYYLGWDRKQVTADAAVKFDMDDIRALLAPLPKERREMVYAIITDVIAEANVVRISAEVQGDNTDDTGGDQG